ncbi:DUF4129 domain-containing protein [Bacillus shivajii]|uniref:DUF4129 domain-containing protein n=1 Tax=Bacillus shivajii TaxID=1983719 RepID=UPI001CFB182F|nr:DUF4129 domain-containing protein [Bacillus shivajii]UCZ52430.1 DUF4129 domain-containing protein [Bacillus shivajii]
MKPSQTEFSRWMYFLIEITFIYVFVHALYIFNGSFPYIIEFLVLCTIAAATYRLIIGKTNSVKLTAVAVPFIFLLGVLLNFEVYASALLSVLLFWRVLTLYEDPEQDRETKLFFLTFGFALVFYLLFYQLHSNYAFLVIIFIQFFHVLLYKSTISIFKASGQNDEVSPRIKWVVGGLFTLSGLSVLIGMLYPAVKAVFLFGASLVAHISYTVAQPIFYFFGFLQPEDQELDIAEGDYEEGLDNFMEEMRQTDVEDTFIGSMSFYWILLSILLIIAFIYILKMKWNFEKKSDAGNLTSDISVKPEKKRSFIEQLTKRFLTKNDVRKWLYELEVVAAKYGYGRGYSETLAEWLFRLPLEDSVKQTILNTYQSVRYADKPVKGKERDDYKVAIQVAKRQIKEAS